MPGSKNSVRRTMTRHLQQYFNYPKLVFLTLTTTEQPCKQTDTTEKTITTSTSFSKASRVLLNMLLMSTTGNACQNFSAKTNFPINSSSSRNSIVDEGSMSTQTLYCSIK